jgi:hypothetical protein
LRTKKDIGYYWQHCNKIEGWLDAEAARIIARLSNYQRSQGIRGDIFEIGVHHGKLTVLLGLLLGDGEHIGVCDIFDDQSHNVSRSGHGSKAEFQRHWLYYFNEDVSLTVHEKPSQELTPADTGSKVRIFSIDGGHTAEETYGDLHLAKKALLPEGFILVDDYFDPVFPGVSEGINRFLLDHPDIRPVMHFFNKMMLVKGTGQYSYNDYLNSNSFRTFMQHRRLDYSIQIFHGHEFYTFSHSARRQLVLRMIRKLFLADGKLTKHLNKGALRKIYANLIRPRR